jgi:hypothetical protein
MLLMTCKRWVKATSRSSVVAKAKAEKVVEAHKPEELRPYNFLA